MEEIVSNKKTQGGCTTGRWLTVECCVHPTNVDEEADHGHSFRGFTITKQLVAKDF